MPRISQRASAHWPTSAAPREKKKKTKRKSRRRVCVCVCVCVLGVGGGGNESKHKHPPPISFALTQSGMVSTDQTGELRPLLTTI